MELEANNGPIEVWLTQDNMEITCRIVFNDETTDELDVDSLSMRGAQREMTGWLIGQGYEPVGRWAKEDDRGYETMRRFRRPQVIVAAGRDQSIGTRRRSGLERPLMANPGEFSRF